MVPLHAVVIVILLYASFAKLVGDEIGLALDDKVVVNKEVLAAFDWINVNTEKDAVFSAEYAEAGMCIPAFTNRACSGTHLHFIHLVRDIDGSINAYSRSK